MSIGRWRVVSLIGLAAASACQLVAGIEDLPTSTLGDGGEATDLDGARANEGGVEGTPGADAANDGAPRADAGTAADGASCRAQPKTCGPMASTDCCESPLVPGGTFKRSYDGVGYTDVSKVATVSDFRLDMFEVTVGRFRRFVEA